MQIKSPLSKKKRIKICGILLCLFLTCGFLQTQEEAILSAYTEHANNCTQLGGHCKRKCITNEEASIGQRSGLCKKEMRCCIVLKSGQEGLQRKDSNPTVNNAALLLQAKATSTIQIPIMSSPSQAKLELIRRLKASLVSGLQTGTTSTSPRLPWPSLNSLYNSRLSSSLLATALKERMMKLGDPGPASTTTEPFINYPGCGIQGHSRVRRVVGGTSARRLEFPWMVYITRDPGKDDLCGAALVSNKHVITAAHCFDYLGTNWPTLKFGEYYTNVTDPSFPKFATGNYKVAVHPKYNKVLFSYDIAVLTLSSPVPLGQYKHIRPICLPTDDLALHIGDVCTVAGWGSTARTAKKPAVSSPALLKAQVPVVDDSLCKQKFALLFNNVSQICAGDLTGASDACVGDSGGPLMRSYDGVQYLMGVISSGATPCAQVGAPSLYTDVLEVRPWIHSIMVK